MLMTLMIGGCGDKKDTSTVETTTDEVVKESDVVVENKETDIPATTSEEEEDTHTPKESDYVEYLEFYGPEKHENKEILIDTETFKKLEGEIAFLSESVDLYYSDGCPAGYSKSNIEVQIESYSDDWYNIYFDIDEELTKVRLVKKEDFDAVAVRENNTKTGTE